MGGSEITEQVRQFYDRVGWQVTSEGFYQNARYEDLRPVSSEYIHRCHLRVKRWLKPSGNFLMDAGSGPIQYPEYLTYSEDYRFRICVDISMVALQEARKRVGDHGLCVVADVANLPFRSDAFDGIVSLHTLHHLPVEDQVKAYHDLYRVLQPGASMVLVNGWTDSPLMKHMQPLILLMERVGSKWASSRVKKVLPGGAVEDVVASTKEEQKRDPTGTYIHKQDAGWLRQVLKGMRFEIRSWRSVSVRFLRAVIHRRLLGKFWLRVLFGLEERFPHWFGENGQYPLVIIWK